MWRDKPSIETKLTLVGLLTFLVVDVLVFFMMATKATLVPMFPIIAIFVAITLVAGLFIYLNQSTEKAKRELNELDTYSFIDALLADLSRDEFAYLKHLVDDRSHDEELSLYNLAEDDLQASPMYQSQ